MNLSIYKRAKTALLFSGMIPALLLVLNSCKKEAVQTLPQREWELVWSDEFNGAAGSAPDNTKWGFDIGTGTNGWGNAELQYYTNRPDNIKLDGSGKLVITAKSESYAGSGFTSARIKTKGKFAQAYGRFAYSLGRRAGFAAVPVWTRPAGLPGRDHAKPSGR